MRKNPSYVETSYRTLKFKNNQECKIKNKFELKNHHNFVSQYK